MSAPIIKDKDKDKEKDKEIIRYSELKNRAVENSPPFLKRIDRRERVAITEDDEE